MKQYNASKQRVKELKRTIYKVNPKWKRKKGIRAILLFLLIAGVIATILGIWKNPGIMLSFVSYEQRDAYIFESVDYLIAFFIYLLIFVFIPAMIYFIYRAVLKDRCRGPIGTSRNILITTDTELRMNYAGTDYDRNADVIQYKDMRRILWNEVQQRFEIFAPVIRLHYVDYQKDKVDSRFTDKSYLEYAYQLYWIYSMEDLQSFKDELQHLTGLEIGLRKEAIE